MIIPLTCMIAVIGFAFVARAQDEVVAHARASHVWSEGARQHGAALRLLLGC